jgi:phthiodiolone/phenolphthiodiolone dimycocerosates ketoreductase
MLRAAGRYGDGFFPAFSHTPQEYARRLEVVRTAASDAGRDPMSIVPAMCLPVVTGRTRGEVDEALESEVVKAGALNASDEFFAQHGAQHPLGAGFTGAQDLLPQDWDERTALSHIKTIPSSLLRDMALVGTAGEVIEQAAEWRDCGVSHVVLLHCSVMQRSLRNGLAAMGPFLKIIRGLKKL